MSNKLVRDVDGWARRVLMDHVRFWLVVEGEESDAPFYDGLIRGIVPDSTEWQLLRAKDIKVDGVVAGGKQQVQKIFLAFEKRGVLSSVNSHTRVDWLMFLDKDDDDFLGELIDSQHVLYTSYADVEAEIVGNTDLTRALSVAFNLTSAEVRAANLEADPLAELATLWEEWILLRLTARACQWHGERFSGESKINRPLYGPVDRDRLKADNDRGLGFAQHRWALSRMASDYYFEDSSVSLRLFVKGKWLPHFLEHKAASSPVAPYRGGASVRAVMSACLSSLTYADSWTAPYRSKIDALLAEE